MVDENQLSYQTIMLKCRSCSRVSEGKPFGCIIFVRCNISRSDERKQGQVNEWSEVVITDLKSKLKIITTRFKSQVNVNTKMVVMFIHDKRRICLNYLTLWQWVALASQSLLIHARLLVGKVLQYFKNSDVCTLIFPLFVFWDFMAHQNICFKYGLNEGKIQITGNNGLT